MTTAQPTPADPPPAIPTPADPPPAVPAPGDAPPAGPAPGDAPPTDPAPGELITRLLALDVRFGAGDAGDLWYDAPPGVVTDELRDELRRSKPALLAWLAAGGDAVVVDRTLPPYNQQDLWARAAGSPFPAVYTIAHRLRLRGNLVPAALTTALARLTDRYPPLRTRFRTVDLATGPQPVQEVLADVPVSLPVTDLSGLPAPVRERELAADSSRWLRRPLPMTDPPLWRARLFRLGPDDHVLLWTLHHVICDGWSARHLLTELFEEYRRVLAGTPPVPGPAAPTHADFARHQRRRLAGAGRRELVAYWRQALAGAELRLALPYDRPAPARPTWRGGITELRLARDELDRLRQAARDLHTTLYVLLLSAYGLALARATDRTELVLPTSYAGRGEPGYETVVGLVADRLPIRIRPGAADTFAELVAQVGHSVFAAMDHAMPLSVITQALPVPQRPSPPYPTALFTVIEAGPPCYDAPGLRIIPEPADLTGFARMDLYCFLYADPTGLRGAWEYALDRFSPATVDRFAVGFADLLRAVATDPKLPLHQR